MIEYCLKAFATLFVGFLPNSEIYVAIPLAVGLGLDYFSAVIWAVVGNYAPVILIYFLYEKMIKREKIAKLFTRLSSVKLKKWMDRHGSWLVLLSTPLIGVWEMAVVMKLLKMNNRNLLLYSFISITAYALIITFFVAKGVNLFVD